MNWWTGKYLHSSGKVSCLLSVTLMNPLDAVSMNPAYELLSLVLFGVFLLVFNKCGRVPVVVPGVAGDWKNHFTPEQLQRFASVLQKELQNESFTLPWSLEWSLFTQKPLNHSLYNSLQKHSMFCVYTTVSADGWDVIPGAALQLDIYFNCWKITWSSARKTASTE